MKKFDYYIIHEYHKSWTQYYYYNTEYVAITQFINRAMLILIIYYIINIYDITNNLVC